MYMYSGITSGRVLKGGVAGEGNRIFVTEYECHAGDISLYGKIPLDVMYRPILYSICV